MKKIVLFILTFVLMFSLAGCGKKETVDELKDEKQVVSLVNSYVVDNTNGFDYSLEQKLSGNIVNAHAISIRLDNSNGTIGSRVEYKKDLNEDISQGQYTEVNATAYYKNSKIATYENDSWVWKNCQLNEFASINISSFNLDVSKLKNLNLSTSGKYSVLTFTVDDSSAAAFLGVSGSVKNLSFEIKTDTNLQQLVSFVMSYSQELTTTKFSFTPYYGSVNIDLPA